MLKTSAYGLGFQHLPRDLANVNAWKTMFDPYIEMSLTINVSQLILRWQNKESNLLKEMGFGTIFAKYTRKCIHM